MRARKKTSPVSLRLKTLQDVAVELMNARQSRDLLDLLVNKAVDLLGCDAGTLYLKADESHLAFEVAVNRSVSIREFQRVLIPISGRGLAAYVFRSAKPLRIKDVYKIADDAPYGFDSSFDRSLNYRTQSTVVQPLKSSKGEVLGVLQLINRMPQFTLADERLLESFAAVASASLDTARLHKNIEDLFEGFVKASVHAIESRDEATRGHSERVAILTVDLARKISASHESELRDIQFNETQIAEIRYASLLHDFGKIGVPESILQKEEKLSLAQKSAIRARITEFEQTAEIRALRGFVDDHIRSRRVPDEVELAALNRKIIEFRQVMEERWGLILDLCRPTVLNEDRSHSLDALKHVKCCAADGHEKALLLGEEVAGLRILKGSLSHEERLAIEAHVSHSFAFLKQIPWTKELSGVPDIAHSHHERLDGSGYPRKISAHEIPVQAKIMAVADVFDALVANDRPYKPALPIEKVLSIIEAECRSGKLETKFFKVFHEARVYECDEMLRFNAEVLKKAA